MKNLVKAGLIGFGTVGSGVARIMLGKKRHFTRRLGFDIELVRIADLDVTTDRGIDLPNGILTTDANNIITDPDIDIVIELIGGYEPARTLTLTAFKNGKSVVTANKALLAKHGGELLGVADKENVSYLFEAAVGGGIPIIRGIVDSLNANIIESLHGILNGTTNYILTGMTRDGLDYDTVLAKAQKLGYAEADPSSDVSGKDALNKLVILARLAFGADLDVDRVYCEGVENIGIDDISYARELGYTIKLLAIAKLHTDGRIEARVHPTLVPDDSIMAYVEDEFNAVELYGDAVGREIFFGKGAGMMPAGSAVVSDVVHTATAIATGARTNVNRFIIGGNGPDLIEIAELSMRYYLRFLAVDQAGVLTQISRIFADQNISIESVIQKGTSRNELVPLVIMTHEALEGDMQKAMAAFAQLDVVRGAVQLIRVEDV